MGFILYCDLKDTHILRKPVAIAEDNNNRLRQIDTWERRRNYREKVIETTKEDRAMEIARTFLQQRTTKDIQ